ncbi:DNA-binding transcriptional regulator BolA [Buchnera aphidicola (Cinara kochiana kochiana)]|uniref:DNA-binding transcriptional regulator BolA n=1 Tax=Buchnera aphidicola (Cinara kochiana kochiana) TaxID=2518976 RepID=A0A451D614_9GAMM|nr:BolA/IbaG family iron-sulfur metabolism protein [Buchnera aphidicola]VFP81205.1 DNA-binding transcriptional regulator BolA [Buchnera aphidicola (Cinara kochiana kochiana)]
MKKIIEKKIMSTLEIYFLKIYNTSYLHNSYKKKSKHFTIIISAYEFNNLSLFHQHNIIYKIFYNDIPQKIYSIQLHTYSINQWNQIKNKPLSLIPCIHKQKTKKSLILTK